MEKKQMKTVMAGVLMLISLGSNAVMAEEKKTVSRKDLMDFLGPVVADAYPYFTEEERKSFSHILREALKRKIQLETEKKSEDRN